jgi:RND family efflux transporter MFP subunit
MKAKRPRRRRLRAPPPRRAQPLCAIANGKADVEGGIIQVAARRQGIVREVLVQEGEDVVAGQILAKQEDDDARLAADTASAGLNSARAQLALYQVQLRTGQREYKRLQNLSASNFVAGQRLDAAQDQIASANANIQAQQAAIQVATAQLAQARYNQELTIIRAPADGRIARRYANPGAGASTLNVTPMFDLEPQTARIVRAEIVESDIPNVTLGQEVEISPEADPTKTYIGKVLRRAAVFGARKLPQTIPAERTDERVVEVVVSADGAPFLIGQRVLVKFMKPGQKAGAKRDQPKPPVRAATRRRKASFEAQLFPCWGEGPRARSLDAPSPAPHKRAKPNTRLREIRAWRTISGSTVRWRSSRGPAAAWAGSMRWNWRGAGPRSWSTTWAAASTARAARPRRPRRSWPRSRPSAARPSPTAPR